jgi:glutamine amidotransferase
MFLDFVVMCRFAAAISSSSLRSTKKKKGDDDLINLADIMTNPVLSMIQQSFDCRERGCCNSSKPSSTIVRGAYQQSCVNGDGYGIGWYIPSDVRSGDYHDETTSAVPVVQVQSCPAWSCYNLKDLSRAIHSNLIFAHIRAAGPGTPVTHTTCHPFKSRK